jgi:hypothetical protein
MPRNELLSEVSRLLGVSEVRLRLAQRMPVGSEGKGAAVAQARREMELWELLARLLLKTESVSIGG